MSAAAAILNHTGHRWLSDKSLRETKYFSNIKIYDDNFNQC